MMKLYIRISGGRRFFIPIPIGIVKLGCRFANSSIVRKNIPSDSIEYIDCIDFKKLEESFDVLKQYKGLKLVDVRNKDGTEVIIII